MADTISRIVNVGIAVAALATNAVAQGGPQRTVLVTGASSGIGRKVTERLAANGFFVYAGARAQKDSTTSTRSRTCRR